VGMLIPITALVVIAVVIIAVARFRYKERTKLQDTLRALAESSSPHQAELVAALAASAVPQPERDLRSALKLFGVALGLIAMAFIIGLMEEGRVIWPLVAFAVFPLALGAGQLLLWRMAMKRGGA
jgi:hypothetical protein